MSPKNLVPVKILDLRGRNAVLLDLPAGLMVHPTVSIPLIKPYHPRAGVQNPPVLLEGVEEWELDAVSGHNLVGSSKRSRPELVEFKAKWKGNYEDSWHELVDFENAIPTVERYLLHHVTRAERYRIWDALRPSDRAMLSPYCRDACAKPKKRVHFQE